MLTPRTAQIVIYVVTAVWVASFALTVFRPEYRTDPQIHVAFMGIVGGAMAILLKKKNGNGDGTSKGE